MEIFVSSQSAGFHAVWHFPGSLEDLRARWPQLMAVHLALRRGEPLPPAAGCGSLELLVDCSIGALESFKADADASMRAEKDGARVTPKSGAPFTLSWPAEEASAPKTREVSTAAVAAVLAALVVLLWFCEDCARFLGQIARVLR